MSMSPKIALVTVLYKSDDVLADFLKSLSIQHFRDFHLYLVDNSPNAGTDQLLQQLLEQYPIPFHTHLKNQGNVGVAAANNQGIEAGLSAGCSHTLLLNNDVFFNDTQLLEAIYQESTQQNRTIIVPKILYYGTNKIWMAGGILHVKRASTEHIGDLQEDEPAYNIAQFVSYAPTCFMLINNTVFRQVGLMRAEYFVYYDDTDFIYRASKSGYQVYYMPQIKIWHKVSAATGGTQSVFSIYYMARNRLFFVRKNYFGISFVIAICLSIIDNLRIARKCYNNSQWKALLRGLWHGLVK